MDLGPDVVKIDVNFTDDAMMLQKETNMFRLFDLILVFLERVFGLSWGEWGADDRPNLIPNE